MNQRALAPQRAPGISHRGARGRTARYPAEFQGSRNAPLRIGLPPSPRFASRALRQHCGTFHCQFRFRPYSLRLVQPWLASGRRRSTLFWPVRRCRQRWSRRHPTSTCRRSMTRPTLRIRKSKRRAPATAGLRRSWGGVAPQAHPSATSRPRPELVLTRPAPIWECSSPTRCAAVAQLDWEVR